MEDLDAEATYQLRCKREREAALALLAEAYRREQGLLVRLTAQGSGERRERRIQVSDVYRVLDMRDRALALLGEWSA